MSYENPVIDELKKKGWISAVSQKHILGGLQKKTLISYRLLSFIGPKNRFGAIYFQLFLMNNKNEISHQSVIVGLHHQGSYPSYNWIEIIKMAPQVSFSPNEKVFFSFPPDKFTQLLFKHLVDLLPPGGHIMVEYDSPEHQPTARLLASGIPPVATPLGYTLFLAGCDAGFKDWYIAEGGTEGPRKLQGYKAIDIQHTRRKAKEMAEELGAFLTQPPSATISQLEKEARERASAVLRALLHK